MNIVLLLLSSILFSSCLSGCATSFTGSAHVEGGRSACDAKCASAGLECTGMVFMGEYSSACVCGEPGAGNQHDGAAAAATAGAAGVAMQMQQQQQQQAH